MTRFGDVKVPYGKAGTDDALCRGSGTNGLDEDFEDVVIAFSDEMESEFGYSIEFGDYGYISKSRAESLTNRPGYAANIYRYGWGIAWEVACVKDWSDDADGVALSADQTDSLFGSRDVKAMLSRYNLAYLSIKRNGVSVNRSIGARNVTESTDIDKMEVDGTVSRKESYQEAYDAAHQDSSASVSTSSGSSGGASVASVAYFFANQFNSVTDYPMASMLTGERALANDEPLWNYVKKAVNASLRSCSSDPDGNFIAWYPDYFGKHGKTPTVIIKDVELLDLTISQSDKEFYSHVFCPGFNLTGTKFDFVHTTGVVSIESDDAAALSSAAAGDGYQIASDAVSPLLDSLIYIPEGEEWKYTPAELYRRYGARPAKTPSLPNFGDAKLIEDNLTADEASGGVMPEHILPFLYALYEFMNHWAKQYNAKIEVTFMPEVFPGSRIKVESLDISFYVDSVSHSMSYSGGFTTTLKCSCPVGSLVSGMVNPS